MSDLHSRITKARSPVVNARNHVHDLAAGEIDHQGVSADPDPLVSVLRLVKAEVVPIVYVVVLGDEHRRQPLASTPGVAGPTIISLREGVRRPAVAVELPPAVTESLRPSARAMPSCWGTAVSTLITAAVEAAALVARLSGLRTVSPLPAGEAGAICTIAGLTRLRTIAALTAGKGWAALMIARLTRLRTIAALAAREVGTAVLRPFTRLAIGLRPISAAAEVRLVIGWCGPALRSAAESALRRALRLSRMCGRGGGRRGVRRAAGMAFMLMPLILGEPGDRGCDQEGRPGRQHDLFHRGLLTRYLTRMGLNRPSLTNLTDGG